MTFSEMADEIFGLLHDGDIEYEELEDAFEEILCYKELEGGEDMDYGSLQNMLAVRTGNPEPEIGMGATEIMYTDRNPYEVIEIIDDRHIVVRALDYKRTDNNGMSECQDYEYHSNEKNVKVKLFKTKKGVWRETGTNGKLGSVFSLGYAEKYYDFSF